MLNQQGVQYLRYSKIPTSLDLSLKLSLSILIDCLSTLGGIPKIEPSFNNYVSNTRTT